MRPKRVILCMDSDETYLSHRVFLMRTHGFAVLEATTGRAALHLLADRVGAIYVLVTDAHVADMATSELLRAAVAMHPELRTIITNRTMSIHAADQVADAFLPMGACSSAELMERVRMFCARKRGPKSQHVAEDRPVCVASQVCA